MKKIFITLLGLLAFIPVSQALAHQSGCHRWHSCPSDTGSYVCGDLSYTSGCPKATLPVKKVIPVKPTPKPVVVPVKVEPVITPEKRCLEESVKFGDDFLTQKGYLENNDGSWTNAKGKYPKSRLENKLEKKQTEVYTKCVALSKQ